MKTIEFNGESISIYMNKNRLEARDEQGFPYMVIGLPHKSLNKDEVAIKNYSENTGILEALLANNIVDKPHRFLRQGFVTVPVCKLLL